MAERLTNHPKIEMVRVADLKPNPNNPRKHSRKSILAILASINRFGFTVPLVLDRDYNVIAGNGRYLACIEGSIEEAPVVFVDFLTPEDYRAYALAENRIAELSGWDESLLAAELNALFGSGYGFEVTGFTTADLNFALPEEKPDAPEEVELPNPDAVAVSRLGDLWLIGPHRLLCGDSRVAESYEKLLNGELAAMVFSDAPYGVKISNNVSGLGKVKHGEFAMMSGEQTPAELTAFLRACFRNCVRFSEAASIHYQCMDWRHIREITDAADGVYTELKNLAVWVKPSGSMGTFYRSQHELIFIYKSGTGKHKNNFGLGRVRALSHQRVSVCRRFRLLQGPQERSRRSSDDQEFRACRGLHFGLLGPWRLDPRPVLRVWNYDLVCTSHRSPRGVNRNRSDLRRYRASPPRCRHRFPPDPRGRTHLRTGRDRSQG